MQTARRTHGFRESVIRGMTRLAREYQLDQSGAGLPQLSGARRAQGSRRERHSRRYQPVRDHLGRPAAARGAGPEVPVDWYALEVDPEREITVTCGATEAMIATLLAVVNPGDEVIVFEPFYENYGPDTILADARPVYVPLEPGQPLDRRPAGGRVLLPDPRHHREHAQQPGRTGTDSGGARGDPRSLCPA